ncbi:heme peroxidase [Stipitochalara longipes BDJ]|nr:heme peroxidase [Stipitochalara longipes BDJ]
MKIYNSSVLLFSLPIWANAQLDGIDQQDIIDEVEHILVDNTGMNSVPFVSAVSPCSNYTGFASDPANRGEQTSAQWVRFAFHDFVTADIVAGTGGLDASLGFESDRAENLRLFVNDTLEFMANTTTAYLGAADHIALGVLAAVSECGGNAQAIPLRPSGVPGPFTSLDATLSQFASAGFAQNETIALTACGHSLGHIHYSNFPDIVSESAVSPTNLDGGVGFDSTPTVLDATGMNAYLDGSSVDPLVVSTSVSARFDLRLFSSDNNVTITALAQNTGSPSSGTGSGLFGSTTYFPFSSDVPSGTTSLDIQGSSFPINDNIFVIPDQSTGLGAVTAVLYVPETQQGSVALKITQTSFTLTASGTAGDYTLYNGAETVSNPQNVIAGISLGSLSSRTVKTKLFNGGV